MSDTIKISASIVLYKEKKQVLEQAVESFLKVPFLKKLYIIDNSPKNEFEGVFIDDEIEYLFVGKNIGFGSAHNLVIDKIKSSSKFHLILNPDVTFSKETIPSLINQIEIYDNVSMIAPKVLFPNGKHQYSSRRYPTLLELLARRFKPLTWFNKKSIEHGIYKDKDLTSPFYAEYLTGCFQLYKTEDLVAIKGFDERYFLYMEDVDICKKIDVLGKQKLYYPKEEITHILKQGSSKNIKLFFRHLISAIKYFLKWGF